MKKLITAVSVICLAASFVQAQQVKELKSEISHVTVFPDRAQVVQESPVQLPSGKTILRLSPLSPYIDVQSIQVRGTGDFTIMSVNYRNNYLQNLEESAEVKGLRDQIEKLQIKSEDEKAAITILRQKEQFLVANQAVLAKGTSFNLEQFRSLMDLYTKNIEQVTVSSLMKERLVKDYEKQIAALQKQLNEKLARQQLPSGEISVTVSSAGQASGRLVCSYVVSNAGWYPSYDIRVDNIISPVTIINKANVFQNTGIDWKDVKMSFSNATPWISGDVPVLNPWFIDFYTPQPVYRSAPSSSKKAKAPELMEMAAVADAVRAEESAPIMVVRRTGETTITFDVAVPCSVPSDGNMQTIEIQRLTAPASYKYVTTPKLSALAYLTANISDWAGLSLQSGEATLYFENSYVGKSNINVNQVSDTLALSLGTDNGIVVKREKRVDFTSKRTIGSNKTETYSFLISVRNNKTVPVKMTLNDQIPLSSNSGIDVEALELSGGKLNGQTGEVKWDLDLGKQETRQIILTYSVKYPKDKTVILE
jgi:uncharacterized protein (TIGR02231 family)